MHDIVKVLDREDRFCPGTLAVCSRKVGQAGLRLPTLSVINTANEIASLAWIAPFVEATAPCASPNMGAESGPAACCYPDRAPSLRLGLAKDHPLG